MQLFSPFAKQLMLGMNSPRCLRNLALILYNAETIPTLQDTR